MDEQEAQAVAHALGDRTWNSGGEIWLVVFDRSDGKVLALSEEVVCEYQNMDELQGGSAAFVMPLH